MSAGFRLEIFVADVGAFVDFYTRVLGFELIQRQETYAAVRRGEARIGAALAWASVDRRARAVPTGAELVVEVGDLAAERDRIVAAGWPLETDIQQRSWGLSDFRLYDPDGYYLRFTTREEKRQLL